ncbi:hypothetical protein DXG03_001767 [Asterophora parasitica]|uniref:Leucine--tRNA ligase RagD-binding domain-containing protein n=1 Tax=Asterophora parasitica TaxID=117018 RepID=A0A9P7K8K2_9AGAR|nr:hypothetical protein DXG03_001767 [Asterophora parasitica]
MFNPAAEAAIENQVGGRIGPKSKHLNPEVYVLSMDNVLATKVRFCDIYLHLINSPSGNRCRYVLSNSPDDRQTLYDLRTKAAFYKIDPSSAAIDPITDTTQLAEEKEIVYKEGFYNGTMLVGEFKGQSVKDAKAKVQERMLEAGLAFAYAEPECLVISWSADECAIAQYRAHGPCARTDGDSQTACNSTIYMTRRSCMLSSTTPRLGSTSATDLSLAPHAVTTTFPEWQDTCMHAVKEACDEANGKVEDVKVRELLTERGLIKDKRAMPFVQAFKKRMSHFGAQMAFRRTLPFSEGQVLREILPYLKKSLGLVDVEVLSVEEARQNEGGAGYSKNIIDSSEPGSPAFEYRNV